MRRDSRLLFRALFGISLGKEEKLALFFAVPHAELAPDTRSMECLVAGRKLLEWRYFISATTSLVMINEPLVELCTLCKVGYSERLLGQIRWQIGWFIKDELETMQAFLRAAEATKEKDELVKVSAKQVRDLAYDIQDCLEEFIVHLGRKGLLHQLVKLRHRHRIALQIRRLKLRFEEVSNRNLRYNLIKSVPSSSRDDSTSNVEVLRYQAAHYVHEAELVGFSGPKKEVLELISSSDSAEIQVIWIIGAGGLGKTTLARKVYERPEISAKFASRAWITVSRSFSIKELLKEMIKQLLEKRSLDRVHEEFKSLTIHEHHLADHLKTNLKEIRYFLVLDDVWNIQDWDCIKPIFWGDNEKGSRVIVTTRKRNLMEGSSSSSLIYNIKALEKEDATKLLLRKTRRNLHDIQSYRMTDTFEKIIKKCGGLPLAIITIGALLATKDVNEWERFYNLLPSELESNGMQKVIALRIGKLKELQILESVNIGSTSSKAIKELGELTRLRKLAVETQGATEKKWKILCESIQKLSSLCSLSVSAYEHQSSARLWLLVSSSAPPPELRNLCLVGYDRLAPIPRVLQSPPPHPWVPPFLFSFSFFSLTFSFFSLFSLLLPHATAAISPAPSTRRAAGARPRLAARRPSPSPALGPLPAARPPSPLFPRHHLRSPPSPSPLSRAASPHAEGGLDTALTGPVPASLGNATALETLALNSNQLSSPIPASLKNLLLFDNKLSGELPPSLGDLHLLESLRVGGNHDLSGPIPESISKLSNVVLLGLADTKISGQLPTSLGQLQSLETLLVYTTSLSGAIKSELGNCSNLTFIYLYENMSIVMSRN
ncbi:hypothetical protein EJB05_54333, partial [Eragrostis curvula]